MDLEEYNKNLRSLAENLETRLTERVIVVAANRMLATMHNRIFQDGLDSRGASIGMYSTAPGYFTKDQFVKKGSFKPIGKGGKANNVPVRSTNLVTKKTSTRIIKTSGKDRKSMYLKDGYKEFRDIQGRPTTKVNFQMRGDLKLSLTLQAKEREVLIGFDAEQQSLKRKGLEVKFKGKENTIFPATSEEKDLYSVEVVKELQVVETEVIKSFS